MRAARTQRTMSNLQHRPAQRPKREDGAGAPRPHAANQCQTFNTGHTHSDSDLSALPQP